MAAIFVDGVYALREKLGEGSMAAVYLADVDLARFDYTMLYAYALARDEPHLQRRARAGALAAQLREQAPSLATMRTELTAQNIPLPGPVVALKIITTQTDITRFEGEWQNLLGLNHPHVIKVYGGGLYLGRAYYAMEYLQPIVSLERIRQQFSIREKLGIIIQAGTGLQYLHDNGIVHRDLRPDNLVTCEEAPGSYVTRITDLGLAKNVSEQSGLTRGQSAMGDPRYMPPEQFTLGREITAQADLYALGASLYELMTGYPPFHNKDGMFDIMSAVAIGETPIPPRQHVPNLPAPLAAIIECAMAREPAARYAAAAELVADLETYLSEEHPDLTQAITFAAAGQQTQAGQDRSRYHFAAPRPAARPPAARTDRPPPAPSPEPPRPASGPERPAAVKPGTPPAAAVPAAPAVVAAPSVVTSRSRPVARAPTETTSEPRKVAITIGFAVFCIALALLALYLQPKAPGDPAGGPGGAGGISRPKSAAELTAELHAALRAANPEYTGQGEFEVETGRIVVVKLVRCGVRNLAPLQGLKLRELYVPENGLNDLSVVKDMPLEKLGMGLNQVRDLSPLHGLPLRWLQADGNPLEDLGPVAGLPLEFVLFSPGTVIRNINVLRGMDSIKRIGPWTGADLPPAEFWRRYDTGEWSGRR